MNPPLLAVRGLRVAYDQVEAVRGIDFELAAGGITSLVGANGAGKTSTLLAVSGLVRPSAGEILHRGEPIQRLAPHRIVRRGIVHVPEGRAILATLTVRENLELGAYPQPDRALRAQDLQRVHELFPRLAERAAAAAGELSGGEQQMLAIGRALMARPSILLLDEPSMGLAPLMVQEIFRRLVQIQRAGITVLLVEQNVRQALRIAQRAYVIETGRIVLAGAGTELLDNPRVRAAYLGG